MQKGILMAVIASLMLAACGQPLTVGDKTYPTYGLLNKETRKSKNVCYEVSVGNIFWSFILIETVIAPIYFIGFDINDPVRLKKGPDDDCSFDG